MNPIKVVIVKRDFDYKTDLPFWRVTIMRDTAKTFDADGRMLYRVRQVCEKNGIDPIFL